MIDKHDGVFPLTLGSDRIYRRGDKLVIYSRAENADWQVHQNRKVAIIIGEQAWWLSAREGLGKRCARYTLEPWPEYMHCVPGRRIRHDDDYVQERDAAERRNQTRNRASCVLIHFRLIIGFLPSGVKFLIEENFGISSRNASFASIILELLLLFAVGATIWVFSVAGIYLETSGQGIFDFSAVSLSIWISLVLFADLVIRYDSYWRASSSPLGFCEWAVKWVIAAARWVRKLQNK